MTDKEKLKYYESQIRKAGKSSNREKCVTPVGGVIIKSENGTILVGNEKKYDRYQNDVGSLRQRNRYEKKRTE